MTHSPGGEVFPNDGLALNACSDRERAPAERHTVGRPASQ
jgi:hypothetical protein